jgi:hypothetical protein
VREQDPGAPNRLSFYTIKEWPGNLAQVAVLTSWLLWGLDNSQILQIKLSFKSQDSNQDCLILNVSSRVEYGSV